MLAIGAIISISGNLGYLLPAIIGLESFGVPSPGETALILASVLASEGKLQIWLVLVIGISSAIVGDTIGYELGRHLGREILTARGPLQRERIKAIDVGERFFHKHGNKTVFFARWITGVRSAAAWLAGIDRMHYPTFLAFNAAGAITWGVTYGLVGYYGGRAAADVITTVGTYALIAIAALAVIAFVVWRVRKRRAGVLYPEGDGGDPGDGVDPDPGDGPGAGGELDAGDDEAARPTPPRPDPERRS
jgi:membrane protein DedA with SNARE-associated domain